VSDSSEAVDELDQKVLVLRQKGQAYAKISRDLGLERASEAQQAFQRAVRRLPEEDAKHVRDEEVTRLDRFAERVRADTSRNDMDRARQLKTIERMRTQLYEDRAAP
jgi:AraC-like DNA-binding protein